MLGIFVIGAFINFIHRFGFSFPARRGDDNAEEQACRERIYLATSSNSKLSYILFFSTNNRTFSDGTEQFDYGSASLLSEMRLHIELRAATMQVPTIPYAGIRMVDGVDKRKGRTPLLERRMGEYQAYVDRGGILSEEDMKKLTLVEEM